MRISFELYSLRSPLILLASSHLLATPSFLWDARQGSDICDHPTVFDMHGLYINPLGPHSFPKPHSKILPVGTICKAAHQGDILTAFPEYLPGDDWRDDQQRWDDKITKVFWEGHYTDLDIDRKQGSGRWRHSQRARLHRTANPIEGTESTVIISKPSTLASKHVVYSDIEIAEAYYDMRVTPNGHGGAAQCQRLEDDGTCLELENVFGANVDAKPSDSIYDYKYLMDVDGE